MKRSIISLLKNAFLLVIILMFIFAVTGCQKKEEGPLEKAGKKADEAVEATKEAVKKAEEKVVEGAEKAKEAVEKAGEKVAEGTEKAKDAVKKGVEGAAKAVKDTATKVEEKAKK
jgi:hyperosmotically inducible protein